MVMQSTQDATFDREVSAFDIAHFGQAALGRDKTCPRAFHRSKSQNADNPRSRLLPARRKGPRHRTAYKADEFPPPHADTSKDSF
jgi:hypothetical protein